jgi:PKD repeat protein
MMTAQPSEVRSMRRFLLPIAFSALVALSGCSFLDALHSNEPPTAVIAADPVQGRAPLHVQLDASDSFDDGTITEYLWEFATSTYEERADGISAEHSFETSGVHTVRLQVIDETGLAGTAEITITVDNTPPLASCRFSSDSPVVGEWILFDASASYDPDGRLVDFVWDFGDGTSMRGTRVGHAYEETGVYSVRLTIEDDAGATVSLVHTFTVHLGGGGGGCGGSSIALRLT